MLPGGACTVVGPSSAPRDQQQLGVCLAPPLLASWPVFQRTNVSAFGVFADVRELCFRRRIAPSHADDARRALTTTVGGCPLGYPLPQCTGCTLRTNPTFLFAASRASIPRASMHKALRFYGGFACFRTLGAP